MSSVIDHNFQVNQRVYLFMDSFLFVVCFETGSQYIALAGQELTV